MDIHILGSDDTLTSEAYHKLAHQLPTPDPQEKDVAGKKAIIRLQENATRSVSKPKRRKTRQKPAKFSSASQL